jgi:hypothetical protein
MLAMAVAALAVMVTFMAVFVGVGLAVEMVVLVGVLMVMLVGMGMLVCMGHTVVGVLMGVGMFVLVGVSAGAEMIVMQMHKHSPLHFSFIIAAKDHNVKVFIFAEISPWGACETEQNGV